MKHIDTIAWLACLVILIAANLLQVIIGDYKVLYGPFCFTHSHAKTILF